MYLYRKRHVKTNRKRCSRKNAKLKAKNRRRKARAARVTR
jgi:hypothetical protein